MNYQTFHFNNVVQMVRLLPPEEKVRFLQKISNEILSEMQPPHSAPRQKVSLYGLWTGMGDITTEEIGAAREEFMEAATGKFGTRRS